MANGVMTFPHVVLEGSGCLFNFGLLAYQLIYCLFVAMRWMLVAYLEKR